LGPARLTIPYVKDDGSRGIRFTEDLELASLYILADARRGTSKLEATVPARYPMQLRKLKGGALMIDLLGIHKARIKYNRVPDVDAFLGSLDKSCDEPGTFLKDLKRLSSYFKEFSSQETVTLEGLVTQPGQPGDVMKLIDGAMELDPDASPAIFDPVMGGEDVKGVTDAFVALNSDITEDQKTLARAKGGLRESQEITKKVLKEETLNQRDSSNRIQARLKESLNKKRARLKKKLDRDVTRIRASYRKQTGPLREERTRRKRKLTRAEKRIVRLRERGEEEKLKAEKKAIRDTKKKFKEMDDAVKSLQSKMEGEIKVLRDQFDAELKGDEDRIEGERLGLREKIEGIQALEAEIAAEAKAITGMIDALVRKKRNKLRSLERYSLDLDVDDVELNIPFYIFQYGKRKFDYHPPVEVAGTPGLLSRFRRMLADSLETKVNMLIKPQQVFAEKLLERVIKSLRRDNPVWRIYRQEAERLNLFRSHRSVDLMMTGLMKMRRGGWISDGEYIRLQEGIVEKLGSIPLD